MLRWQVLAAVDTKHVIKIATQLQHRRTTRPRETMASTVTVAMTVSPDPDPDKKIAIAWMLRLLWPTAGPEVSPWLPRT